MKAAKPIDIRVLPLTGRAIHRGDDHPHTMGHDFIAAGVAEFGALSYSLLRAEAMTLHQHRAKAARVVLDRFMELDDRLPAVAAVDEQEAHGIARQGPRLLMWDLIALVGEACEQLAAEHAAVRAWREKRVVIADTLLAWQTPSHTVFASPEFQDLPWWRHELGVDPDPARLARLTPKQRRLVRAVFMQVAVRLPVALDALRTQYTPELHRVAMRRKHLVPLLDATLGLVFATTDTKTEDWVTRQVDEGALILADDKVHRGRISQIVVPVTAETISALLDLWTHANWLSRVLAGATISRAENLSGAAWSWDYDGASVGDPEDLTAAMSAYTGAPLAQVRQEVANELRTSEVMRLAEARSAEVADGPAYPPLNRADRRAAARRRRG